MMVKNTCKRRPVTAMNLPTGRHMVCFWKQNDLGLLGRRPDRWIAQWAQDPTIEKVLVFEAPVPRPCCSSGCT
jgi:hypothetical protein